MTTHPASAADESERKDLLRAVNDLVSAVETLSQRPHDEAEKAFVRLKSINLGSVVYAHRTVLRAALALPPREVVFACAVVAPDGRRYMTDHTDPVACDKAWNEEGGGTGGPYRVVPLYEHPATPLRPPRGEDLERAAKVCDERAREHQRTGATGAGLPRREAQLEAVACAAAIRALKEPA